MSGAALDARFAVQRHGLRVDAHLRAEPGEVIALIGPSGAGKSTILTAIAGSLRLLEGEISIGGRIVSTPRVQTPAVRRGVVLLDQDARLFPHLTAAENVAFGLRARGVTKAEAGERSLAWLERVGLGQLGDRSPARLSGGQQQRVALARALAVDPALVLLDEPFTSLDVETAAGMRTVVREQLAATAATAVVVTHAAEDAAALASRIVVVEAGAVVQEGTLREVFDRPATRFAAAFAGLNRVEGVVKRGVWSNGGTLQLSASKTGLTDGVASAVFHPANVRVERAQFAAAPAGDRCCWEAQVLGVQQLPAGMRVVARSGAVGDAVVSADVDGLRAAALALVPGDRVLLSLDRDRIRLVPATPMPENAPQPAARA